MDTSSLDKFEKSMTSYRKYFGEEVIGIFDDKLVNPNPKTRGLQNGKSPVSSTSNIYNVKLV